MQQNMQFDVDADIYMAKKKNVILIACNVNKFDSYNTIADTCITWL